MKLLLIILTASLISLAALAQEPPRPMGPRGPRPSMGEFRGGKGPQFRGGDKQNSDCKCPCRKQERKGKRHGKK